MTIGMQAVLIWAALFVAGFLGHLVGDYLIQNNWMAQNKAKPFNGCLGDPAMWAITLHATTWIISVQIALSAVAVVAWGPDGINAVAPAASALGVIHWVQDRRWPIQWFMRVTGKDPSVVWLLIVVDNVWHLLQIAGAAAWIVWRMT